jgi:putative addiction module killer protein
MTYLIHTTAIFDKWFNSLKDKATRYRLETRLSRITKGHFGDVKPIDIDLFELRFFFGSGFRIYYTVRGSEIVLLLCGGDKSSQSSDIEMAKKLLNALNNED